MLKVDNKPKTKAKYGHIGLTNHHRKKPSSGQVFKTISHIFQQISNVSLLGPYITRKISVLLLYVDTVDICHVCCMPINVLVAISRQNGTGQPTHNIGLLLVS